MPSLSKSIKLIVICLLGIAAIICAGGAYNYSTISKHPKVLDPLNNELYRLYTEEGYKVSKVDLTLASFIKLQYQLTIQALQTGKSAHISLSYGISGSNNISKETALKIKNKDPRYAMAIHQLCGEYLNIITTIKTFLLDKKLEGTSSKSDLDSLPTAEYSSATIYSVAPEKAKADTFSTPWIYPPILEVIKDYELSSLSSALSLVSYSKVAQRECIDHPANNPSDDSAMSVIKRVTNLENINPTETPSDFIENNRKYKASLSTSRKNKDGFVSYTVAEKFDNQEEMNKRLKSMLTLADNHYISKKRDIFVFNYENEAFEASVSIYRVSDRPGLESTLHIIVSSNNREEEYYIGTLIIERKSVSLSDLIANSAKE